MKLTKIAKLFLAILVTSYIENSNGVDVKSDGSIVIPKATGFAKYARGSQYDFFSVFRMLIEKIRAEKENVGLMYPESLCAKALMVLTTEDDREMVIKLLMLAHLTEADPEVDSIEDSSGQEIALAKIKVGRFKRDIDISEGLATLLNQGFRINFH